MALSGSANKRLVAALVDAGVAGGRTLGRGRRAAHGRARSTRTQYGHVGAPAEVNAEPAAAAPRRGLPAGALAREPLDRPGDGRDAQRERRRCGGGDRRRARRRRAAARVRRRRACCSTSSRCHALGPDDAQRLIDDGTARGGMAAKLQAALSALEGGVQRVRISDIAAIERTRSWHGTDSSGEHVRMTASTVKPTTDATTARHPAPPAAAASAQRRRASRAPSSAPTSARRSSSCAAGRVPLRRRGQVVPRLRQRHRGELARLRRRRAQGGACTPRRRG